MDKFHTAEILIHDFSTRHGIEVSFSENGIFGILLDEKVHVTLRFEPEYGALLLHAPIGRMPASDSPGYGEFLLNILTANYLWKGGDGLTLSLALDVLYAQKLLIISNLAVNDLDNHLFSAAKTVLAWRNKLEPSVEAVVTPPLEWKGMINYG
jgi:hypothetical protein